MNRDENTASETPEKETDAAAAASAVYKAAVSKMPQGYWAAQWKRIKKHRRILWFIIPAATFTLIFSYIPMLGVLFSFKGPGFNLTKGDVMYNLTHGTWTFQNYKDIFTDNSFYRGVGNTLLINIVKLALCFPLSILIAVQLSELKNQTMSKAILILICIPNFLSWAIVIGIWNGLLDSQGGALNQLFVWTGILPDNYFVMAKEAWFKPMVIFLSAWKGAGWGCIMFYAAIMAIDKSYYESATLEGANKFQKMWYLTIPSIVPTIALMLVMNFSGMMSAGFEQIYTMMQANANFAESQITLDTYLYEISVVNRTNIPFATALGVFNGLIALALMLIGNKITVKTLHRSLW